MTSAQIRLAVLLTLVGLAGFCLILGGIEIPHWNRWLTTAGVIYVIATVYAQVTKPRGY